MLPLVQEAAILLDTDSRGRGKLPLPRMEGADDDCDPKDFVLTRRGPLRTAVPSFHSVSGDLFEVYPLQTRCHSAVRGDARHNAVCIPPPGGEHLITNKEIQT